MDANKIVVWTNPTAPFQKIYVFKEGVLVDQMGVKFEDAKDVLYALLDKYNLTEVNFSGTHTYGEKIATDLDNDQIIRYGKQKLNIKFV